MVATAVTEDIAAIALAVGVPITEQRNGAKRMHRRHIGIKSCAVARAGFTPLPETLASGDMWARIPSWMRAAARRTQAFAPRGTYWSARC